MGHQRPPDINMASKRSTVTVIAPSSPTHYTQPPTPEHPPPSPMTAVLGIQEKINPKVRVTLLETIEYSYSDVETCWVMPCTGNLLVT
jgi:hypothetical protein